MTKLLLVDDVASLLPLYLEGDRLALYMEMDEENQRDINQIAAQLEAFTYGALTAYRMLTVIRWAGEQVNIYPNRIRQLVRLAVCEGVGLERLAKLTFVTGFLDAIFSIGAKH